MDHKVLVLDKKGRLVHVFDQEGEGPEELKYPMIMGVDTREIVLRSKKSGSLLVLDHELKIKPHKLPPMRIKSWHGLGRGKHRYLINSNITSNSHSLTLIELAEKGWKVTEEFFPIQRVMGENRKGIRLHNQLAFYFDNMPNENDDYEVEIHDFSRGSGHDLIQVLQGNVSSIPSYNDYNIFIDHAYRVNDQYVVMISVWSKSYQWKEVWLEWFREDGKHMKKEKLSAEGKATLIPVQGKDDVYLYDVYEGVAKRLNGITM
jgi:hypothetical protein